MPGSRRTVLIPFVIACALSLSYIFIVGIDWGFDRRVGVVTSAIFTGLILSSWATVPYLVLLPIALREARFKALAPMAVLMVFAFGAFTMHHEMRHMPGDEGLYFVIPAQQLAIAVVILVSWLAVRTLFRRAAH